MNPAPRAVWLLTFGSRQNQFSEEKALADQYSWGAIGAAITGLLTLVRQIRTEILWAATI